MSQVRKESITGLLWTQCNCGLCYCVYSIGPPVVLFFFFFLFLSLSLLLTHSLTLTWIRDAWVTCSFSFPHLNSRARMKEEEHFFFLNSYTLVLHFEKKDPAYDPRDKWKSEQLAQFSQARNAVAYVWLNSERQALDKGHAIEFCVRARMLYHSTGSPLCPVAICYVSAGFFSIGELLSYNCIITQVKPICMHIKKKRKVKPSLGGKQLIHLYCFSFSPFLPQQIACAKVYFFSETRREKVLLHQLFDLMSFFFFFIITRTKLHMHFKWLRWKMEKKKKKKNKNMVFYSPVQSACKQTSKTAPLKEITLTYWPNG